MTSKEEQEVKRLKLTKEKQNTVQHERDTNVRTATEVTLPGIPAGPTKVCIGVGYQITGTPRYIDRLSLVIFHLLCHVPENNY